MQRYSDGLAVPKYQMDSFTGAAVTTNAVGSITLDLTYAPKSVNDILVNLSRQSIGLVNRFARIVSLTGKALELRIYKLQYRKFSSTSETSDSGGAGADPHSHAILFSDVEVEKSAAASESQDPMAVHYWVG